MYKVQDYDSAFFTTTRLTKLYVNNTSMTDSFTKEGWRGPLNVAYLRFVLLKHMYQI